MKKLLSIVLGITLATYGSAALADNETISIKKAGDTKAKVAEFPSGKDSSIVSISFDSGASWDSVKDSYTVPEDVEEGLEHKKFTISIAADGTATFHKVAMAKK